MSKNSKITYSKDFYKTKLILKDKSFLKSIKDLKNGFKNLGCPLPKNGLENEKSFESWKEKYWRCRGKVRKEKKTEIYNQVFRDILISQKIDPKNNFYKKFLKEYVFFNKTDTEEIPTKYKVTFNKKSKKHELFIQIFPHTTKKDIEKIWKLIEQEKKHVFKDEKVRARAWQYSKRDLEIYNLYSKLKKTKLKDRKKFDPDPRLENIINKKLSHKYGNLSFETIRRAVNKVKKVTDKNNF